MNRLLTTIAGLLGTAVCFAHSDTTLKLQAKGALQGLPAEYSPASLRITFAPDLDPGETQILRMELTIRGKSVVVPTCVTRLILTRDLRDVRVVASWYHRSPTLPHYVDVMMFDPGDAAQRFRSGYKLLFNLSNARLLRMEVMAPIDSSSIRYVPVDLTEFCQASELIKFYERAVRPNTSLERTRER